MPGAPAATLILALLLPVAAPTRAAALWGFVDGEGVAHVAAEPPDGRFQLVLGDRASTRAARVHVAGKTDLTGSLLTWLEIAPAVRVQRPWLREAALQTGLDVSLLTALVAVESGFDATAVSPRGALGLLQITPVSGERYATAAERLRPVSARLLDPRTNIHTGARMLADLMSRFGRLDAALAAWNAGEGRVRRHGGEMPPIAETQAHVQLVLELYWALLQRDQARRATRLNVVGPP
jgi:hypothetical protein